MAKVKTTAKFKIIEFVDKFIDGATANSIGRAVVDGMKEAIAEGQSPVRGNKRFARYKDRYSYPGKLKPHRPVNLNLTGEMVAGLGHRMKDKSTIEVGMTKGSADRKKIAGYHNTGTENMAARPFIPQDGEEFSQRIMNTIRDAYSKRLATLIKKANKKR